MKKLIKLLVIPFALFSLTGCDLLSGVFGGGESAQNNDKEYDATTGKFCYIDENKQATDNYFIFDGSKNVMSFEYYESGAKKLAGTFRFVITADKGKDRSYCFMYCFDKKDGEKEDVVYCYSDDFSTYETFTQFTIMQEEKKFTNSDKLVDFHTYRISELPYKMGTYVREGSSFKEEKDEYLYADQYFIPSGTYVLNENVSFTSFWTKQRHGALFAYRNGDVIYEGMYWITSDKTKTYNYIQHDMSQKVTRADKEIYDTTFDIYYPPDVFLHGDFDVTEQKPSITINDLIIQEHAPNFPDNFWQMGTYTKI